MTSAYATEVWQSGSQTALDIGIWLVLQVVARFLKTKFQYKIALLSCLKKKRALEKSLN